MDLAIPIYIEQIPQPEQPAPLYLVRPLYFPQPVGQDEELQRAIAKFVKAMRRELNRVGRLMHHDQLSAYSFAPEIEEHFHTLTLDLKARRARCKFLFVAMSCLDRRVVFTPSLPQVYFDLERGEDLHTRATAFLTRYFRGREKPTGEELAKPEEISVSGKAWTSTVEIEIHPPSIAQTPREEFRAMITGNEALDGEWELQQVGRCLDWLYPNELTRVICREREVEELTQLLKAPDCRPVLLIGPRQVGKTAIIEEYVYRVVDKRKSQFKTKNNLWLIAPQRLISGMSYVGQWENRLLAIIQEAKTREHILYFDDLLGLFKAGVSCDSNLNVAQVLKPYIERREIRVLGEITPEAWRVLREQDRGFADLFQLAPVSEPDDDLTLEMLLGLIRQLEHQHRCSFDLEALPAAIDLQRRYIHDAAFPGKAAAFLRQTAVKYRGETITRSLVIDEFQAKSGLAVWFLGDHQLSREKVIEDLSREVIGQPSAIEAVADAICLAKARLNDPERPLASFLFLGPTGVGKTQSAKSLAKYLFGEADRLIRFDMNEFVSPDSVMRLVGSFAQPEGLLTTAVRRQPFALVLLDEIEKAHRDVFNLLLQVMGDGRLTDALGRTTDFSNVILILTSNLGVKEAGSDLGFSTQRASETSIYVQAAEKFFSPEFFNRLDRIVPFQRLNREAVERIAYGLINQLFQREGLARRKCALYVDKHAIARIVESGFHPQLGARALKRAVEKDLAQPVANRLSTMRVTAPTVINVLPARNGLRITMQELVEAEPLVDFTAELVEDPAGALARIEQFIDRVDDELTVIQPHGAISIDAISPSHRRYFSLREQAGNLRSNCQRLNQHLETQSRAATRLTKNVGRSQRRPQDYKNIYSWKSKVRQVWKDLFAAEDLHAYFRELAAETKSAQAGLKTQLADAVRQAALLSTLSQITELDGYQDALVMIRRQTRYDQATSASPSLSREMSETFVKHFGFSVEIIEGEDSTEWMVLRGWGAVPIAKVEEGTHLLINHSTIDPVQVKAFPLVHGADPRAIIDRQHRLDESRIERAQVVDPENQEINDDLFEFDPVIRLYAREGGHSSAVDLRTGLTALGKISSENHRTFLLAALPLPPELRVK